MQPDRTQHNHCARRRNRGRRRLNKVSEPSRTTTARIRRLLSTENGRIALLIPLWSLAITSAYSQALFQRAHMTFLDYAIVAGICFIAGMITIDLGKALLSYLAAMALGTFLLLLVLSYPAYYTTLPSPGNLLFTNLWIVVVFTAVFPIPFVGCLVATIIGAAVGENYF